MHENVMILFSITLLAGMFCQWLSWRVNLPAIIFLLLGGILAGPVLHWLEPDKLLGDLLFPFVSLAVAVILFEGSMTLKFHDLPGLAPVIRNLITLGVFVSWGLIALVTKLLLAFSWEVSFLFAALMVVTGPTVIMPMLRSINPNEKVANILQWEGVLLDPIGAILAVLVFEFIVSGGTQGGFSAGALVFGKTLIVGGLLGSAGGLCLGLILKKYWIPQYLYNFAALAFVCTVFSLSNLLGEESGLLSVTIMGIWLGNMKDIELEDILNFKESLSILLISILFIVLSARIDLNTFVELGWPAIAVFAAIQFLVRPISVYLCAYKSELNLPERHVLAWIAPRGIVAAAISALFALKLKASGYEEASLMVPLTFSVIIGTVLLQSFTAGPLAKWLKVAKPYCNGFLIVGANQVAQVIAKELKNNGFQVFLADPNWDDFSQAKMNDLPAYWGSPVTEHAERHINLTGLGYLLAITPHIELNALAARHYRQVFGPENIYTVKNFQVEKSRGEEKLDVRQSGRYLFGENITYQDLSRMLYEGATVKTTELTEEFSFQDYLEKSDVQYIPLFAINPNGEIYVFTAKNDFTPAKGWKIIGLAKTIALKES